MWMGNKFELLQVRIIIVSELIPALIGGNIWLLIVSGLLSLYDYN